MSRFSLVESDTLTEIVFDDGRMNLLSAEALSELDALLQRVSDARTLLFRSGRTGLFAAGADMLQMSKFSARDAWEFARIGQRLFADVERLDMATIAFIDGDCYGGALDLSLAFDFRIATSRSRFAHPGARIGIVTGFGGTVRLPERIGRGRSAKLLLGNGVIDAAEALALGVIDEVVENDAITPHVLELVRAADRKRIALTKALMRSTQLSLPAFARFARHTGALYA